MTSNYPKRITLSYPTHIISMVNLIAISVETPKVDIGLYFRERVH